MYHALSAEKGRRRRPGTQKLQNVACPGFDTTPTPKDNFSHGLSLDMYTPVAGYALRNIAIGYVLPLEEEEE